MGSYDFGYQDSETFGDETQDNRQPARDNQQPVQEQPAYQRNAHEPVRNRPNQLRNQQSGQRNQPEYQRNPSGPERQSINFANLGLGMDIPIGWTSELGGPRSFHMQFECGRESVKPDAGDVSHAREDFDSTAAQQTRADHDPDHRPLSHRPEAPSESRQVRSPGRPNNSGAKSEYSIRPTPGTEELKRHLRPTPGTTPSAVCRTCDKVLNPGLATSIGYCIKHDPDPVRQRARRQRIKGRLR